jgi:hypothetical protein
MNKTTFAGLGATLALSIFCVAGCERRETRQEGTNVTPPAVAPRTMDEPAATGGGPLAINAAVDQIASARCAREMKCGNVGADKKYADQNACTTELKKEFGDDLNANDCPAGVDQKELGECLAEIKNEDCGNPLDTISRLAACRTSDMCKNVR